VCRSIGVAVTWRSTSFRWSTLRGTSFTWSTHCGRSCQIALLLLVPTVLHLRLSISWINSRLFNCILSCKGREEPIKYTVGNVTYVAWRNLRIRRRSSAFTSSGIVAIERDRENVKKSINNNKILHLPFGVISATNSSIVTFSKPFLLITSLQYSFKSSLHPH
jgi:hypothetical protein